MKCTFFYALTRQYEDKVALLVTALSSATGAMASHSILSSVICCYNQEDDVGPTAMESEESNLESRRVHMVRQ